MISIKVFGLNARTMSILFMVGIIFSSIIFGSYVVLTSELNKVEGYERLTPIQNSPLCGSGSAHEVPLWDSSIITDSQPTRQIRNIETTSQTTDKQTTSSKYNFLENEIDVPDTESKNNQRNRELSGLDTNDYKNVTNKMAIKRPKMTGTKFTKMRKGARGGFGVGTVAIS